MISADTNIVVRFLTGDDKAQFARAKELFTNETVFIATTVFLETEWVLRYAYKFSPDDIRKAFSALLGLANVVVQDRFLFFEVLEFYQSGMDFADAIHLLSSQECRAFATFDRKLMNKAKKLISLRVFIP
jgi:predicted nucleic-acid-binding protein